MPLPPPWTGGFSHPRCFASVSPTQALGQKPSLATRFVPDGGWSKEVAGLPASVVRVTGRGTQIPGVQKSNQLPAQGPFYLAPVLFSYGTVSHQTQCELCGLYTLRGLDGALSLLSGSDAGMACTVFREVKSSEYTVLCSSTVGVGGLETCPSNGDG